MNAALLRWLPLPILGLGGLAAFGIAFGRSAPEPSGASTPPPLVRVVEARPQRHSVTVRTHGSVEPHTEIDLLAEIAGRIVWVSPSLETGSFFAADEVLLRLDDREPTLALERAKGTLLRVQSEAGLARSRLARLRALEKSQISSASELEAAEHELGRAQGSLREARATRDRAALDLERTRIRAPFAGRVREKRCGVGSVVARGAPLARIYAVDYAEVRLPVPVRDLAFLDLPLARDPQPEAPGPTAVLRAEFGGRRVEWPAHILRSEGQIAPRSRMLNLVARVEDPYGLARDADRPPLTVGLFVEAEIRGRRFEDVFLLPRSVLRGRSELFVAEAGRLVGREVEVLRFESEEIAVTGGLAPGELVALSAASAVDGQAVRPVAAGAADTDHASIGLPR